MVARMPMLGSSIQPVSLGPGYDPDVAYSPAADRFLVVWEGGSEIQGARVSGDGLTVFSTFAITARVDSQLVPAVACRSQGDGSCLVVWRDGYLGILGSPSRWDIWGQVVGMTGPYDFIGPAFEIAGSPTPGQWLHYDPDLAYNSARDEYLVAYTRGPNDGSPTDVYSRRVAATGALSAEHPVDNSSGFQDSAAVAAYAPDASRPYLVVYRDGWSDTQGDVRAFFVDGNGQATGLLLNIATVWGRQEGEPAVAARESAGGYTVVWAELGADWNVWGRRILPDGAMGDAFPISVSFPAIVGPDERYPAVTSGWTQSGTDIGARRLEQAYSFGGDVIRGTPANYIAPIGVATVQVFGDSNTDLADGYAYITSTVSTSGGEWGVALEGRNNYAVFHVLEVDPPGTISVAAQPDPYGIAADAHRVTFQNLPLGRYYISFFDQQTPPKPAFLVAPGSGTIATVFAFDASATTDDEEPAAGLQVRWDWNSDGTYDTAWSTTKTAAHQYGAPGLYTVRLQAMDSGGLTAEATQPVTVSSPAPPPGPVLYLPLILRNH